MMMPFRRNSPAAQRFAERRRREDEAPHLRNQVPALCGLELTIEERSGAGATKHIRRFMVDSAPALFLVACGDPRCLGGEHDLTTDIMRALRASKTSFEGSDDCMGNIGSSACLRVLHFSGTAQYAPVQAAAPLGFIAGRTG
jgi:hypothetical protein